MRAHRSQSGPGGRTALGERSLSLSAPLELNKNVHGTAFAGSLYAAGVLCAFYLGREWLRTEGLAFELERLRSGPEIRGTTGTLRKGTPGPSPSDRRVRPCCRRFPCCSFRPVLGRHCDGAGPGVADVAEPAPPPPA